MNALLNGPGRFLGQREGNRGSSFPFVKDKPALCNTQVTVFSRVFLPSKNLYAVWWASMA